MEMELFQDEQKAEFIRLKGESLAKMTARAQEQYTLKDSYQGVTKNDIEGVLKAIGRYSDDNLDAVWVLLMDDFPSMFPRARDYKLCDGASTSQIGSIIGLTRGRGKLDREGRDMWIKPLRELGAIQACTYEPNVGFLPGHIKAKTPYSGYRLSSEFVDLLKLYNEASFAAKIKKWIDDDSVRARLKIQTDLEAAAKAGLNKNSHKDLIRISIDVYAKNYLPNYVTIYKDDSDGDRISDEEQKLMKQYGIELGLGDSYPDVILYNPDLKALWFIEAVTSDGEVDEHKMVGLKAICEKSNKALAGSTTTYLSWKTFAKRQQSAKNLADLSNVWIYEDPEKQFLVKHLK